MGKYDPLYEHLAVMNHPVVRMSFSEVERILGAPLPKSARTYPAWWANESAGQHVEARAWLDAGYRTRNLDLNAATVEFVRAGQ